MVANTFYLGESGVSEKTVATTLSYPTESGVITPTVPATVQTEAQLDLVVSPAIFYGAEPHLTTASEVTTPIYYPTCCSSWYDGDTCDYDHDEYYCGHGGRGRHGGYWGYDCDIAPVYGTSTPLTINEANTVANEYLTSLDNPDLAIANVQEYTTSFRFSLIEKSTGVGAYEMSINKYTGYVYPTMGPCLTWNTKYGIINGELTVYDPTATSTMPVTVDQAQSFAQQYLSTVLPATTIGNTTPFYGYYNIEVLSDGNIYTILSVNGYTGQIWYHAWHECFIQEVAP